MITSLQIPTISYYKNLKFIAILFMSILFTACDVDYKTNPNESTIVPTSSLLNSVQKQYLDATRNEYFSGGQALVWMQYWAPTSLTEESRYLYQETNNIDAWNNFYTMAQDLISIIELNTDAETKTLMSAYGSNATQIAAARLLLVNVYLTAMELWGDIPYYSYLSTDETFQSNTETILQPVYATQEAIYSDMLKVLGEVAATFATADYVMDGDNFFDGDAAQWGKYANSLKLRIANRIKHKSDEAMAFIDSVKSSPDLFLSSNDDNVGVTYEDNAVNGAPMYIAFQVRGKHYFGPSVSFVELLKGKHYDGSNLEDFNYDPRLEKYAEKNEDGFYVGVPFVESNVTVELFTAESDPSHDIINKADRELLYMEYAEVCFILSEINDWDQSWYEKGIMASMSYWGVEASRIDEFIANVAPASEKTVMTQKYIALYMQPMEAWSEYRRTAYPTTLIMPNTTYTMNWEVLGSEGDTINETATFSFVPLIDIIDLPYRNKYPTNEQNINNANVLDAAQRIGGDEQDTELWWMN